MSRLIVVMYHYVRDLERSRFPAIKGLTVEKFRGQIDYLGRHARFVRVEDVLAALRGETRDFPPLAALLTFDDGYSDHFRYVFPILDERGIQGCFFPPLRSVRDRAVLDVNKIHFALAACDGAGTLAAYCLQRIDWLREEYGLDSGEHYLATYAHASRFDDAETIFVKRLLQRGLPEAARARIADELFRRFVTTDEAAFAEELYLSPDQVKTMRRAGMYFGAHGVSHRWLDSLDREEQRDELRGSREMLAELGYGRNEWIVGYPFGGFNDTTLEVAREEGFSAGFTIEARIAAIGREDALRIPRLDTADLPHAADGPPPTLAPIAWPDQP
ncbi:MAG: polysaccharide deacetylase family protein [Candidatus Eisenbacteria bacterium]